MDLVAIELLSVFYDELVFFYEEKSVLDRVQNPAKVVLEGFDDLNSDYFEFGEVFDEEIAPENGLVFRVEANLLLAEQAKFIYDHIAAGL